MGPAQGAEACTPDGLQPAVRAGQPGPLEEAFHFHLTVALSGGGQHGAPTWGCTFILKWLEPQDMWGRPREGSCVTREAGDSSHLLMPYNPVLMEYMHTVSVGHGRQATALQLLQCVNRAPPEWNAPRLLWPHRKSLLREVLMLRSPKVDRHQYQRGKLTKG